MLPILSTAAMREADALGVARRGERALVRDAGTACALYAARRLPRCYGARVAVLAGPGLNGADGRVAATWFARRGALVEVIDALDAPSRLSGFDLVLDAAFGLGATRAYEGPVIDDATAVVALDLPSGVAADTGEVYGAPLRAQATLALGALKVAHVSGVSTDYVGELALATLGLVTESRDGLVSDDDARDLIPSSRRDHKWKHAVHVFAGSSAMPGAARLVVEGALGAGASMVRLTTGDGERVATRPEVVFVDDAVEPRARAIVAGPGLGPGRTAWLHRSLRATSVPVVLDADALDRALIDELAPRGGAWIITPHEGEFARLVGRPVSDRRVDDVRALAAATGCVVLLKGPTTTISAPDGTLRVVTSGSAALASAGTGDVLAGLIGGLLARGHGPLAAASLAAHWHGRAGASLGAHASASDLVSALAPTLAHLSVAPPSGVIADAR